jgi:arylsulfatase
MFFSSWAIGWFNLSCYNMGIMGYRTPKIDGISQEGAVAATGRPVSRAA